MVLVAMYCKLYYSLFIMKTITTEKIPIKAWLDDIDTTTLEQAKNLANLPFAFKWVALMPDAHPGYGMPIGGVLATKGTIVPNAVGVDIGCGMEAVRTSLNKLDLDTLKKITGEIRRTIPVGFRHHNTPQDWEGYGRAPLLDPIQKELENSRMQIGTLGGGNHFMEILHGDDNRVWIIVHSGSRNFGFKTASYYHKLAVKYCRDNRVELPTEELAYFLLDNTIGKEYFAAMNYCQDFAQASRDHMMRNIKIIFQKYSDCTFEEPINIHHNFASEEEHFGEQVMVHRKGAVMAFAGMKGIVPGSMGTPTYITEGLGNEESFSSCAHGAGRVLGRNEAIRTLNLEEERQKMLGILGAPRTKKELQEAPGAYKDIDKVMNDQKDLVKILVRLTPLSVVIGE